MLAGLLVTATVLMAACIALGYHLAQDDTGRMAMHANHLDVKRPDSGVVLDRMGDLSGRLIRLEIEAAALARRLGIAPSQTTVDPARTGRAVDGGPQGGPLMPLAGDAPMATAAARQPVGEFGVGLSHLESEAALLEASIERMTGILSDRELTTLAYPNRLPVPGRVPNISSGFGVRHDPFTGRLARHMGLDIPATYGTAILASGGGRVLSAGFRGPYGNAIVIDHGHGLQTLYGHCSKLYVRTGELVMPQQKIAAVGSTGRSTGPHLHFEVIRDGMRVPPGQVLASVLPRPAS